MKKLLFLTFALIVANTLIAQNEFWGMTYQGGTSNLSKGVIYKTDNTGNNQSLVYEFSIDIATNPRGSLIQLSNGIMLGAASSLAIGGQNGNGVIYEYNPTTNSFTTLIEFNGTNGKTPNSLSPPTSSGLIYGLTWFGGVSNKGVLYEYNLSTNTITKKVDFDGTTKGTNPSGALVLASNGKFYGVASNGGANNKGVLFEYNPSTNVFIKKVDFDGTAKGKTPSGALIQASNGKLYGIASSGGANNKGVLFEYNPTTNAFTNKIDFDGATKGQTPNGPLMQASNGKLYGMTYSGGINDDGVIFEYNPSTNVFTKKVDFDELLKGAKPNGSLMQASNGKIYGMAQGGIYSSGVYGLGVLFEFNPSTNAFIKKVDFDGSTKGSMPTGTLLQATNGKLYGATKDGGTNYDGVIFEYNFSSSTYTKKIDLREAFNGQKGQGSLMQTSNGVIYGMNREGGGNNHGVLFEFNPTTNKFVKKLDLDSITGYIENGALMQTESGRLFGLAAYGGTYDKGVLYEYDPIANSFNVKINFDGTNKGNSPKNSLVQASNGKLYGVTYSGGVYNKGVLFEYNPTTNTYTKKVSFNGTNKGAGPWGMLIQASNGKLYGTTFAGGANGDGVLFEYDIVTNIISKLVDFNYYSKGDSPLGVVEIDNKKLIGITNKGGQYGHGVIFEYDLSTNTFTKKIDFYSNSTGKYPVGPLMLAANNKLYGVTQVGGSSNAGILFEYNPITNTIVKNIDFIGTNGVNGLGKLISLEKIIRFNASIVDFTNNTAFFRNESSNTYHDWNWYFGDGGTSTLKHPSHSYTNVGTYNITLIGTDTINNITDTLVKSLLIKIPKPSFNASSINLTSPPFNVSFINTSTGYNSYVWNFDDGNMSTFKNAVHTFQYNGTYNIILIATDTLSNYTDTVTKTISCSGGTSNPCNFTAELTQPQSSAIICAGDSFRLSANSLSGVTYAWAYNGALVQSATDSIFYAKQQGFYMAVLTNGTCSQVTNNYFALANYTATPPIISIIGSIAPCSNDSLKLEASTGFTNYNWSNGKIGQSIYVKESGYYTVDAFDNNTCINTSLETIINVAMADIPNICAVSVDVNTNHNIIQWQAQNTNKIDSFRVYRESSITNHYNFLGSVAYTDPLEIEDPNSNVAIKQYSYKITAIDTCGKETPVSLKHKTMHLMINHAPNDHWNLIWRPYEGFSFGSYKIYRGTDSINMTLLTTVSSSNLSYTDLTNPSGDLFYQIEVASTAPCGAKSYGTSRSNSFNTKYASGLGINSAYANGISMILFPNPNNGKFTLNINSTNNKPQSYTMAIYNVMGALIHSEALEVNSRLNKQMNFENLSGGVYFIRLRSKNDVLNARFIIQ